MKKMSIFVLAFIFSVISFGIIYNIYGDGNYSGGNYIDKINDDEVINVNDKENECDSISIIMVGDSLIHDDIYEEASRNALGNGYDFKPMLRFIKPIVSEYDIGYYNQETILGGSEIGVSSYPAFNSPYEVGDAMIDAGFNLVSLATNHTIDRGEKAVLNSRSYWNSKVTNSKNSVLAVGSYSSEEERNSVQIREANNISYTMLNYTYGTNGISVPTGRSYLVNVWPVSGSNPDSDVTYQNYKEQVKKDIENVRNKVDLLIVAMHWGVEYETTPNAYQKDIANYLAGLDVDIIIGTHPHVVQPIEWIDDTLVIYSLGNFISAHEVVNMDNRVGLMSSVDVIKNIDENGNSNIVVENLENELIYTYYTSNYESFLVIPFSEMSDEYLSGYRDIYDRYKKIINSIDNNIIVKDIE